MRAASAIVALVLTGTLSACGSGSTETAAGGAEPSASESTEAATFDVAGTLTLKSDSVDPKGLSNCIATSEELFAADCVPKKGDECDGSDGFGDIATGAQVKVNDNTGATVALGELGQGTLAKNAPNWSLGQPFICTFPIEVSEVPDSGDIYSVTVGTRDPFSFSKADAQSLALSLGR